MKRIATIIGVAIVSILCIGVFVEYQAVIKEKLWGQNDRQTAPSRVVFQPEAQILNRALDPKEEARIINTALAEQRPAQKDVPITAKAGSKPYAYDTGVCTPATYACFKEYYKMLVSTYGVVTAMTDMKQRYNENPFIAAQCHPLTHVTGQEASKRYSTVSEAYAHGDSFCWSGYYHGVLEGVVGRIGLEKLPSTLNAICADIPGKKTYNFDYFNCVHALGHGIMEALDDKVFDSLAMCDNLTGAWEQNSCHSGVFMENIIAYNYSGTSDYLKASEPLYPCTAVDAKYKEQCYLGQTSYALQVTSYDFKKVFGLCAGVEDPYRNICNQSMGRDIANQMHHDVPLTKNACWLPPDADDRTNCVIGAAKEFVSYYHSDTEAKQFCGILTDPQKEICMTVTESYYRQF